MDMDICRKSEHLLAELHQFQVLFIRELSQILIKFSAYVHIQEPPMIICFFQGSGYDPDTDNGNHWPN